MAQVTLRIHDAQCWIYPAKSYTGYDYVKKDRNKWYNGHSRLEYRGVYCHQGGTRTDSGDYNGNMMSIFLFKDSAGRKLKDAISALGGAGKISSIKLKVYCTHGWSGAYNARVCFTPYWNTTNNWGSGGLTTCPHDNYDSLGIKHVTTVQLKKNTVHYIDLTNWKDNFNNYESLAFYHPGAYNVSNSSYGRVNAQNAANPPELIIEYNTNSAPYTPDIAINTQGDSHGYITPNLDVTVINRGDPDNNLNVYPYFCALYNQSGHWITESGWSSNNRFYFDVSGYRGQTVKVRGYIRDSEGLMSYRDHNVYINSRPYWSGLGANAVNVSFSSGVNNGVFKDNVTINWPRATDAQGQHQGNLRYSVYAQKGTDNGPGSDGGHNLIASNLTGTSLTVNAAAMGNVSVAKGERVYFSVWVSDGLESSDYRLTSNWIYRDKPPSAPTNVSPTSGHYESNVHVSWSASQGANGTWVDHYVVRLLNRHDQEFVWFKTNQTSINCTELHLVSRGEEFKFQVYAVDNLGNASSSAYSGLLRRNSAPSKPLNFRVNSDKLHFKGSIPLIWGASADRDGDAIRYNVYFNANNGGYQELTRGTSSTSISHDISGFNPGTKFNYYVEAYDTFNVYSEKTYINAQPQVNVPPQPPEIKLPISDRALYTNVPRIVFSTKAINNSEKLKIVITANGQTYDSVSHSSYFNKSLYGSNENGMFIIPSMTPLYYSKKNSIVIKVNDGMDDSSAVSYNYIVEAPLVNKIEDGEDRLIKASELDSIKTMINSNRFAYGMSNINWYEDATINNPIYKKFFEQAIESSYGLANDLNNKAGSEHTKRLYTKDILTTGGHISKKVFNNINEMILKP